MKNINLILLLILSVSISGCSLFLRHSVDDQVNAKWPPVDYSEVKRGAISRSHAELQKIHNPALLMNVPTETIKEGFAAALLAFNSDEVRILSSSIQPEEQGVRFITNIEGIMSNPKGKFKARVEGWGVVSLSNHTATIQPVLKSARLTDVKISSWQWAAKPVGGVINSIIDRYINNINGLIKPLEHKIDPKSIGLNDQPSSIEVSPGKSILIPGAALGPAAVLIDKDGLHLLAQLDVAAITAIPNITTSTSYKNYEQEFWQHTLPVRSGPNRNQAGVFLSTTFITNLLDPVFTPLALEDLQQVALENTLETIKTNGIVAAGAAIKSSVLIESLKKVIEAALQDSETIDYGDPHVSLTEQTVVVKLPVEGRFEAAHMRFKGEITAAGIIANNSGQLYYRLVLVSLDLKEAEHLGGPISLAPFVSSVNDLLTQLIPYLNGAMDNEPIQIVLPKIKPIPLSQSGVMITPSELTVIEPGAIILVPRLNASGLGVLVVVSPDTDKQTKSLFDVDLLVAQQTAFKVRPGGGRYIELQENRVTPKDVDLAFYSRWNSALPSNTGTYEKNLIAALSLSWAMSYVNQTFTANRIEITAPFESKGAEFDSGHLRAADWLQPSCSVGLTCSRDRCSRGNCSRPAGKCAWSCRKCVNLLVGKVCSDDPICLSTRAACNVKEEANVSACNVAEESKLGACNVAAEAKVLACNTERELQVLGCNIINETIRGIRQLDSIGRFNGNVQAKGVVRIANPEIKYDEQSSKLELSIDANVQIKLDGTLGFTPADIGHILVCPVQGSVNFTADGRFLRGRTNLSAVLTPSPANQDGSLPLEMKFHPVSITGRLSPAPVDALLGQNPHLFILCSPIANVVGSIGNIGKISAYTPVDIFKAIERGIPDNQDDIYRGLKAFTTGSVDETVSVPSMKFEIPKMDIEVLDKTVTLLPEWRDGNLIYTQ